MVKYELINIMFKMCFINKIKWINLRKNTNTNVYKIHKIRRKVKNECKKIKTS